VVVASGTVEHTLAVYVTVSLVSKSSMLCTMLHGPLELVLGNGVVVDVDPGKDVALRKCITFVQKSCVPAAATAALHSSRDMMRMLTIRNTGFSAFRTYAVCQSFIFLYKNTKIHTFSLISHTSTLQILAIREQI